MCIAIIAILSAQERTLTPDRKWRDREIETHTELHTEPQRQTHRER